jgi:hypothetical protein
MSVNAADWLAEFERRERAWFAARDARWAAIAAAHAPVARAVKAAPVVLAGGEDVVVPAAAKRAAAAGEAAGWAVRVVGAVAAVPAKGLVSTVTVRLARHDERAWAGWLNGAFDAAWYVGPSGLERLGGRRMSAKATNVRGVLDVIEGIRGPRQWASLFEMEGQRDHARAVGVLRSAFPALELVATG